MPPAASWRCERPRDVTGWSILGRGTSLPLPGSAGSGGQRARRAHGGDSRSSPLVQEAVHVLFQPVLYLLLLALLTRRFAPCPGGTT